VKDPSQILYKPVVTEKSTILKDEKNLLCFRVSMTANKVEIRKAVETVFGVKVETVRTAVIKGKPKRMGRSLGYRSTWKKAYVKLRQGEKMIEYFEGT